MSQAMELTTLSQERQSEIIEQVINGNLTVKQIREVKSILSEDGTFDHASKPCRNITKSIRLIRISKKTSLALRITLARLDNIINEVHESIEPDQRAEIINFLMAQRLKIHAMIDDTIRFKIASLKNPKN